MAAIPSGGGDCTLLRTPALKWRDTRLPEVMHCLKVSCCILYLDRLVPSLLSAALSSGLIIKVKVFCYILHPDNLFSQERFCLVVFNCNHAM